MKFDADQWMKLAKAARFIRKEKGKKYPPEDGSPWVLPALDRKVAKSKGFNVKKPVIKQSSSGLEISLAPEKRDPVDSIVLLEIL